MPCQHALDRGTLVPVRFTIDITWPIAIAQATEQGTFQELSVSAFAVGRGPVDVGHREVGPLFPCPWTVDGRGLAYER